MTPNPDVPGEEKLSEVLTHLSKRVQPPSPEEYGGVIRNGTYWNMTPMPSNRNNAVVANGCGNSPG